MRQKITIFFIAAYAGLASAQAIKDCKIEAQLSSQDLFGLWRASFDDLPAATVLLEQNRHHSDSLGGGINRAGVHGQIAGDLEDGQFTLEESSDGQHIAATWLGTVVPQSCGREIQGTWQAEGQTLSHRFILRRVD